MKEIQTDDKYEIIYQPIIVNYSAHELKIIPTDPNYEPSKNQQFCAINHLIYEFKSSLIRSIFTNKVEFIDQGENFDSVSCNLCGQSFETEYWQEVMDTAYQNSFSDLTIHTICCNKVTNLNDLKYEMAAGFSKYQLIIIDPEYNDSQKKELIRNLEDILEVEIRLIWAHY